MFRIFGLAPQVEGLTLEEFRSFIHPDDLAAVTEKMQSAFTSTPKVNQKSELDYRIIRHDGSVRTIHSQRQVKELTKTGKLKVVVGVDHDITEQKEIDQVNAEKTRLLTLAEEMANFGSWQLDITQPRATWSPGLFRIFGVKPREQGFTWEEYLSCIQPDDRDAAIKNAQVMFNSPLNHREDFDYHIIRPDGEVRILHAQRQVTEVNSDGKTRVIVGVDQDVTEQHLAEEALKESEERFRIVAEAANVMVYEADIPNRKIHFIHGIENVLGYKPSEIEHTVDWTLGTIHPDDLPTVQAKLGEIMTAPNINKYSIEYRVKQKNGNYITVKDTSQAIKNADGKTMRFIGGLRDITQRKIDRERIRQYNRHLERLVAERTKQLVGLERLAAIGEVAGMVGHDIRNPLQALTGEVYIIRSDLNSISDPDAKQEVEECLNSVDEEISYINKIVADLQDYSRKLNPETTQINLNQLLLELLKTTNIPPAIHLNLNVAPDTELAADPTFLRRALTNLINNAVQAMPEGGNLTITGAQENSTTYITVQDTGVGIPVEVQPKLFTPMFTTKAKGQGLGLVVVKRLIEAQGGAVSFVSEKGKGTRFTIRLPNEART
jgi:PAS domain S-box-containing protein